MKKTLSIFLKVTFIVTIVELALITILGIIFLCCGIPGMIAVSEGDKSTDMATLQALGITGIAFLVTAIFLVPTLVFVIKQKANVANGASKGQLIAPGVLMIVFGALAGASVLPIVCGVLSLVIKDTQLA